MERTISYEYDSMNRVIAETYPDGELAAYSYNGSDFVSRVTGNDEYVTRISYTPSDKVARIETGNGILTSFRYDHTGRLIRLAASGNDPVFEYYYDYDDAGNVTAKHGINSSEVYTYDDMSRLITATSPDDCYGCREYEYDILDNIILKNGRTCTYDALHPHTIASDGMYTYTHDQDGNMTGRSDGRIITYDYENRVSSISDGGSYAYDDAGRRIRKTEGGVTTYYFFDRYEEVIEPEAVKEISYYFANNMRIAQRTKVKGEEGGGDLLYQHTDHLRSSVVMTDREGEIIQKTGYAPYGELAYMRGNDERLFASEFISFYEHDYIWNKGVPMTGDMNDDGLDDFVFAYEYNGYLEIKTKLSRGNNRYTGKYQQFTDSEEIWNKGTPLIVDVNGDGMDDIVFAWYKAGNGLQITAKLSNGDGTYTSQNQQCADGEEIWNKGTPLAADMNGDRLDDIVFAWYNPGNGLQITVKLSNGDGTFTSCSQQFTDVEEIWNKGTPMVADVNGDKLDDIVFAWYNPGYGMQLSTKLSNGDGTFTSYSQQFTETEEIWNKNSPMVADVNSNKLDDIVFAWYNPRYGLQINTKLSNGDGTFTSYSQQFTDSEDIWNKSTPLVADINGDQMDDILFAWYNSKHYDCYKGRLEVKISNVDGTYTSKFHTFECLESIWNKGTPITANINGDERGDIVFAYMRYLNSDPDKLEIITMLSKGNAAETALSESFTNYLYTGQEREKTTAGEMYYYGARYYDPALGRFISPDPLVGELNFAGIGEVNGNGDSRQNTSAGLVDAWEYVTGCSANWYSYCGNNPLCAIDPTGLGGIKTTKTFSINEKQAENIGYTLAQMYRNMILPIYKKDDIAAGPNKVMNFTTAEMTKEIIKDIAGKSVQLSAKAVMQIFNEFEKDKLLQMYDASMQILWAKDKFLNEDTKMIIHTTAIEYEDSEANRYESTLYIYNKDGDKIMDVSLGSWLAIQEITEKYGTLKKELKKPIYSSIKESTEAWINEQREKIQEQKNE